MKRLAIITGLLSAVALAVSLPVALSDDPGSPACGAPDVGPIAVYEGTAADEVIAGTAGADRLSGDEDENDSDDTICGFAGADRVQGGHGSDLVSGGDDNDRVGGGNGDDHLYGDGGDDRINGGKGTDHCFGGAGADTFKSCETITDP